MGEPGHRRARHPRRRPPRRGPDGQLRVGGLGAAASIAVHLRQAGYKLRLVTGGGADVDATERAGEGLLLDQLAEVRLDRRGDIATLVERVRQRADGGLIIALLGALTRRRGGAAGRAARQRRHLRRRSCSTARPG